MKADVWALRLGAAGVGFVVRRHLDLLFIHPISGDHAATERLLAAFHHSKEAGAADAVTLVAEQLGTGVDDFLVADWTNRPRLTVFGDIVVASDLRSMPRLSTAATGTWVERTLQIDGPTQVTVSIASDESNDSIEPEIDDTTDLQAGIVRCRAFRLDFDLVEGAAVRDPTPAVDADVPDTTASVADPPHPPAGVRRS